MTEALTPTLIVLLLLLLNALFVAAEFAIVGVSRPVVERRAEDGERECDCSEEPQSHRQAHGNASATRRL